MKALLYIFGIVTLTLASCSSGLYVGTEYDDLYRLPSDQPVARVQTNVNRQIAEGNLRSDDYYNNIYAADTLVSNEYSDAVDTENAGIYDNNLLRDYGYYDNYSYAGRLRRFYGNYFDPYWRDPFYSSWYPSFGLGFYSGFPSYGYYNPYYYDYYDPFFYNPYYYGGFYGSMYYGGFYSGFYSPFYYGSYYSPYYYGGFYNRYVFNDSYGVTYGRRERASNLSTRWSGGSSPATGTSSRRSTSISSSGTSGSNLPNNQGIAPVSRRTTQSVGTQQGTTSVQRNTNQEAIKSGNGTVPATTRRPSVTTRPEYNPASRSYTPSYSNPRLGTRPSYNNTRVNTTTTPSRSVNPGSRINSVPQSNPGYSNSRRSGGSSYSTVPSRSGSSYSAPRSYSVPSSSRRSFGSSSSSSFNSPSGRSYSGGSTMSRSFSSGSSSVSSSSSRSSSSSSSSSSGGRRR